MKGSRAEVRAYALRLLSYRARSRKEMLDRLKKKGFDDKHITDTIKSLELAGLIDDENLAPELIRYAVKRKHLGRTGIKEFLYGRGLGKGTVERALSNHVEHEDEKTAAEFAEKKLRQLSGYPKDIIKRRLWAMLRRRGFSAAVINRTMNGIKLF